MQSIRLLSKTVFPRAAARAMAAVACTLFFTAHVQASVMQVSPVRVDFEPAQAAQSLLVFNNGNTELAAQVRIMHWSQENGKDHLVPATDIVASPAIMNIEPGKRQTVRLVRTQAAAPSQELSYRVILDELPRKDESSNHAGVEVLLRYSIPVFIEAPRAAPRAETARAPQTDLSHVHAKLVRNASGKTELHVSNQGTHAIRISSLSTQSTGGQNTMIANGLLGYVLPGQQMGWPVNLAYPLPAGMTLKARFNDDRQVQTVPMETAGR